jgi:hypothetical protein
MQCLGNGTIRSATHLRTPQTLVSMTLTASDWGKDEGEVKHDFSVTEDRQI